MGAPVLMADPANPPSRSAPLVWALGLGVSVNRAQQEVNELFDTEMIRLSRQVQATLVLDPAQVPEVGNATAPANDMGAGDVRDLAIAVWDRTGHLKLADREGVMLPHDPDAAGFRNLVLADHPWRVYYLQSLDGRWLVAAGQKVHRLGTDALSQLNRGLGRCSNAVILQGGQHHPQL